MAISFSFPFSPATGSLGYLESTNDIESAIRSNLRNLLVTNWGERVMHYDFGCNMREFLFEPATPELRGRIAERIRGQLAKWMPFLVLTELYVVFSGEPGSSTPENGFDIKMRVVYGNVPVEVLQSFPV